MFQGWRFSLARREWRVRFSSGPQNKSSLIAFIAQLVEQLFCKQQVVGSYPARGSIKSLVIRFKRSRLNVTYSIPEEIQMCFLIVSRYDNTVIILSNLGLWYRWLTLLLCTQRSRVRVPVDPQNKI